MPGKVALHDSSLQGTLMTGPTRTSHHDRNHQPLRHPLWKATRLTRVMRIDLMYRFPDPNQ
jgi:hypothetical protein